MAKASNNDFPSILMTEQAVKPSAPAAGKWRIYPKTDHKFYWEDSGGTETEIGGGGGDVATDTIWDAAGDLVQGTGADTAARLAVGTDYQTLRVNSGATAVEWAGGKTLWSEIAVAAAGGAATVDFTSIPATFRHLCIEGMVRAKKATYDDFWCKINNDGGANYDYQTSSFYQTTHSISEGIAVSTGIYMGQPPWDASTAGLFSYFTMRIPYYANTNYRKVALIEIAEIQSNASGSIIVRLYSGYWRSTAAINRLTFYCAGDNIAQNSQISVYGVS